MQTATKLKKEIHRTTKTIDKIEKRESEEDIKIVGDIHLYNTKEIVIREVKVINSKNYVRKIDIAFSSSTGVSRKKAFRIICFGNSKQNLEVKKR